MCRLFSRMTICHASLGQSTERTTSEAAGLKKGIGDPNCISDFIPVTETIYTICVKGALPPQVMYFNIDPVFKSILYFWLVTKRIGIQSTSGLGNSYPLNYLHHLGITPKQRSFIPQKRLLFQFQMQFFFPFCNIRTVLLLWARLLYPCSEMSFCCVVCVWHGSRRFVLMSVAQLFHPLSHVMDKSELLVLLMFHLRNRYLPMIFLQLRIFVLFSFACNGEM